MIDIDERLIELFSEKAKENIVDSINIGLGYTAVVLKNKNCGVCCTLINASDNCTVYKCEENFEGQSCYNLLLSLRTYKDNISRAIVIAMINALTQTPSLKNQEDKDTLFEDLKLRKNDKLAMIGYFKPLVKEAQRKSVYVKSYDIGKKIGEEKCFYNFVNEEASALIITATSLINNTFNSICSKIKYLNKPVAIIGPSTIMEPKLYEDTPISILGGTYVDDVDLVLKAIRNGKGTPEIHKHSKKVYINF
ncbi:MAG: DUF364 domain-containing protein [Sphaerochaetaceae bacterium]|nr:DUF364 domain-containing protein [Sphaerochaetaceae bacterium]MDC7237783.1 DUF364 domain-containing protein [Sphaerochaetaceae bacterium]